MKQAWTDVADGFASLGRLMKERYRGASSDDQPADGGDAGPGPGAALRDAIDRFIAAGRDVGDRATDVAQDDEVKTQAKRAATSLNDALSATVDMIGNEVGELFKRPKATTTSEVTPPVPTGEIAASEPVSDDARQ